MQLPGNKKAWTLRVKRPRRSAYLAFCTPSWSIPRTPVAQTDGYFPIVVGPLCQRGLQCATMMVMDFEEVHHLIKRGDIVALRRELDNGLDPNIVPKYRCTLLMLAALEGNTQIGELLISRGADVNAAVENHGDTALSLAAEKGHLPFVKLVMDHGAKTNVRPGGRSLSYWMTVAGLTKEKKITIVNVIKQKPVSASIFDRFINSLGCLILGGFIGMLAMYVVVSVIGIDLGTNNVRPGGIVGGISGCLFGWFFPLRWYEWLFP
jgi:ankyrin repeat protein